MTIVDRKKNSERNQKGDQQFKKGRPFCLVASLKNKRRIMEEKTAVETSEETASTEAADETKTDVEEEPSEIEGEETLEDQESADIEDEEVESLDETELLKKQGFYRYVGKGGIEKLLEDYSKGEKGFTEQRQVQAALDKAAKDAGFSSGKELAEALSRDPNLLKKTVEEKPKGPTPLQSAYQKYKSSFADVEWTEDQFGKFVDIVGEALGIANLQDNMGLLTAATGEVVPIVLKESFKEFKEGFVEKHKSEPLAPYSELKQILEKTPGLYAKARQAGQNPMESAYKIWVLENKSDELLSFLAKAMEKKGVDKVTALNNAKKVLKTGKEEITKDYSNMSEEEFRKLPSDKRKQVMDKLIPSIDKALLRR